MDTFIAAAGYTLLIMIVSYVYFLRGKKQGMEDVLTFIDKHEPTMLNRLNKKLSEEFDVTITKQQS
jgi:hypothetical protein